MTDTVLCQIIQKHIKNTFSQNEDAIITALTSGLSNNTASTPEVIARVAINAMRLSTLMSVQMTLRNLEASDIIVPDDDCAPLLEVIKGGKE